MQIQRFKELAAANLSEERYRHTLGVVECAVKLAVHHGLNLEQAQLAGMVHDLAKEIPLDRQIHMAKQWRLIYYPEDELVPEVLHGRLAAYWLENNQELKDRDVLNAVIHHTLGAPGMSRLEMLIYSADMVEPYRSFPGIDYLRETLYDSLEKGTFACMKQTIRYLEQSKRLVHPVTRLAYEDLQRRFQIGT